MVIVDTYWLLNFLFKIFSMQALVCPAEKTSLIFDFQCLEL